MNARIALLFALLLCFLAAPARAAAVPPTLHIQSINDGGTPDLMPGQRVAVIIELRSEELRAAALGHPTPAGLQVESATASSGKMVLFHDSLLQEATSGMFVWNGDVSDEQPIVIVIVYRVDADATPGDRTLSAYGEAGDQQLRASNILRVCCISAPPPQSGYRKFLPLMRR